LIRRSGTFPLLLAAAAVVTRDWLAANLGSAPLWSWARPF
jgi:hypothetical protein